MAKSLNAIAGDIEKKVPDLVQDREQPDHHEIPARKCYKPAKFEGRQRICT